MRLKISLGSLPLLAALSLAGCSKPATPKPQETPAATKPTPAPEPATTTPSAAAQASDQSIAANPTIDQAITANVGDVAKFHEVMTTLQQAVQKHDASTVASLVSYPIEINPHTKQLLRIATPEAFVAKYDDIITPHVADVIARQKYSDLFVNYQGAMFGSGEVWIAGICKDKECKQSDLKIRTIQNTSGRQ